MESYIDEIDMVENPNIKNHLEEVEVSKIPDINFDFPQNTESVAKKLPHLVKDLPIIIVHRKHQCRMHYNFTINRDRVYVALWYKTMHDKFYSDVIVDENAFDDISPNID